MQALCETADGFVLSERDLAIRGAGQILGTRQAGMSDLRVASLTEDTHLLAAARDDAWTLLRDDPALDRRPGLRAEVHNALGPDGEAFLSKG